jgi:hypothetical protein
MQAAPLVGASLLPGSLDKKYIDVKTHHMVIHATVPTCLQDLNAPEWKEVKMLKQMFWFLPVGCQTKGSEVNIKFP